MKTNILACWGLLFFAVIPGLAQNPQSAIPTAPAVNLPSSVAPSLTAHLQMQAGQIGSLNRLYNAYASQRLKQETKLTQLQNQLRQAQAPTSFDQNKAGRLLREINDAQQKVAAELLSTRANALKVLTPVQRSQLESLATDNRISVSGDEYYQLLLMPVEALWQRPLDNGLQPGQTPLYADQYPGQQRSRDNGRYDNGRRDSGSGSYGVYGGYSYGYPDYGVYGNYGQGGVGVHVGIGRGGPSIGVGIGRVFGGIFGGRHRGY